MDALIVPSSIQRIRAFLVEMCGMKVRPWAGTDETLAALHATLAKSQTCDVFWRSLGMLLETLARDLKARQEAEAGTLVDNEVLDGKRYEALLSEIRACLAQRGANGEIGSFRRLAQSLSAPALGLLLLLGGAASIGCDQHALGSNEKRADAAVAAGTKDDAAATATKDDVAFPTPSRDAAVPADTKDAERGVIIIVTPPDAPSPDTRPRSNAATAGPDGGRVTIQDIMDSCNLSSALQKSVLECLGKLRESWSTGVTQLLAGRGCYQVEYELSCFVNRNNQTCQDGPSNVDFDPATMYICRPIPVYIGVRFV